MNETLRNRAGAALPGQTHDDQTIPILTERLTLPPLDLDTTLPDFAAPVSLQLPAAPLEPTDVDSVEEISATALTGDDLADPGLLSARLPEADLDLPQQIPSALRSEFEPTLESVPFQETDFELQDGVNFAVHLEFSPASLPASLPAVSPATTSFTGSPAPSSVAPYREAHVADYDYSTSALTAATPATAPADTGAHWTRIEIELRESILAGLTRQLPVEVEQIVREQIEQAFADIVNRLAIEARMAIAASLREMVGRAVKAELDALRARRR